MSVVKCATSKLISELAQIFSSTIIVNVHTSTTPLIRTHYSRSAFQQSMRRTTLHIKQQPYSNKHMITHALRRITHYT